MKQWVFLLVFLFLWSAQNVSAQESVASADASFKYIATTLEKFRNTGRLVNNPGIDGADLEAFIEFLDGFYRQFSESFNGESAMCRFYRDPENSRMTIEERAQLSFSYLRELGARLEYYISTDEEFQNTMVENFGSMLMDNINAIKVESISNQQLPSSEFDEAAVISFLDAMCV